MKHKPTPAVDAIPAPKRVSKYKINWDDFAHSAKILGRPVLAGSGIKESQVKALRLYDRPPFVTDEGHIKIFMRNSEVNPNDGKRYGDVYFRWIPAEKPVESSET